jgi:HEAT repeat protein
VRAALPFLVVLCLPAGAGGQTAAKKDRPKAASLGSPKEDDPAAVLGVPQGGRADTALLWGLLYAFEPGPEEIRIIAIEDLGLLGDPRALNPLAALIFDPNSNVQQAALRSISKFRNHRAEEILENVVRHPRTSDALKIHALQALPYQASPTCKEFLNESATNGRLAASVRSAARQVLADLQPPYAPSAISEPENRP